MIHVSAIGADEKSPSHYARSQGEGEKPVLAAVPDATILRPSIVFGPEDDFFNRFAAMARLLPALPLIGGGQTASSRCSSAMSPSAVAAAVEGRATPGAIYELGGPEVRTFKELMEFVLATIERRRLLVPLPFALAKLQAIFLQFLPKPLLTPDQVELLQERQRRVGRPKRDGRTLDGLGIDADRDGGDRAVLSVALPQDRAVQACERLDQRAQ